HDQSGGVRGCGRPSGAAGWKRSHTASARRNTAAGVAAANGNVRRSPSPTLTTSTTTGAFASPGGGVALGLGGATGGVLAGAGGASLPLEATTPAGAARGSAR